MKKRLILSITLMVLVAVFAAGMLTGCGNSKPDATKKYVVFTNSYGDETYTLTYPGMLTVEFDYNEDNTYLFYYRAFFIDNDQETGESGYGHSIINANKPGNYYITAQILLGEYGYRDYELKVVIKEKPDLRVMPEVRFDPNGATIEKRDGETVYVYQYDGEDHYPLIHLFYDDQEIDMDLYHDGISSVKFNGDHYRYNRPYDIGSYEVEYWIYDTHYANEADKEKYLEFRITIFVEIQ